MYLLTLFKCIAKISYILRNKLQHLSSYVFYTIFTLYFIKYFFILYLLSIISFPLILYCFPLVSLLSYLYQRVFNVTVMFLLTGEGFCFYFDTNYWVLFKLVCVIIYYENCPLFHRVVQMW